MRPNALKQKFQNKQQTIGSWCGIGSSYSTELLAHAGFDTIVIDLQHGLVSPEQLIAMLQAISASPAMPMVRVSQNDFAEINKALDAGAYGVICPMIDTVADAERFVAACRYPPRGNRSYGPARCLMYGGPDYYPGADDTILKLAMIETPQGLANVDAIAAVDGIDGLFIGPSDLSLALGVAPGTDWRKDPMAGAIDRIQSTARKHGKLTGIFSPSLAFAQDMQRRGIDYVSVGSDVGMLRTIAKEWAAAVRGESAAAAPPARPTGY
ncbi:MAG: HpcH/HpaI aldolase/citrate lyase family protein [Lautropia sp.]